MGALKRRTETPIVFMHTVWLRHYKGMEDTMYAGGFKWPAANDWAGEVYNFKPINGKLYGYVELVHRKVKGKKVKPKVRLQNLGASRHDNRISGVTVVWTAPNESGPGRKVVGWYKNATVFSDLWFLKGAESRQRENLGYRVCAAAKDGVLLRPEQRKLIIPRGKKGQRKGLPGQATLYYPDNQTTPAAKALIKRVTDFIETGKFEPQLVTRQGGAGRQMDPEKRKEVEEAAIKYVKAHFKGLNYEIDDLQDKNVGYDLEVFGGDERFLVEVKGCSGAAVSAEITPNEYEVMCEEYKRKTPNGSYRICIVTNALIESKRELHHFFYSGRYKKKHIWRNIETDDVLHIKDVLGARVSCSRKQK